MLEASENGGSDPPHSHSLEAKKFQHRCHREKENPHKSYHIHVPTVGSPPPGVKVIA